MRACRRGKGGCAVSEDIQVRGVIQGLEATSFQYGTHGLYSEDGELLYALRSDAVRLDDHTGEPVHLHGTPDPDYAGALSKSVRGS
jgi:acyl-CoA thioesterase FadM